MGKIDNIQQNDEFVYVILNGEGMKKRNIIDVHAHVLPEIDDGSRNLKESCCLLDLALQQGINSVIATPHASRRTDSSILRGLFEQTEREFRRQHPDFTLYLGQEIYYHEEMPGRLARGELLTVAGSRYVLVEFDPEVSYGSLYRGIRALQSGGYYPVLAHMERYRCLRREEELKDLKESGCLLQMNYDSLQGNVFCSEIRRCRKLVQSGAIHFLGTDMHRLDYRPPNIGRALEWLERCVDEDLIDEMTRVNPMRMINKEGIQWQR